MTEKQPIPSKDFNDRAHRVFYAMSREHRDNLERDSIYDNTLERETRITAHLQQSDADLGVYGVTIKDSPLSVLQVLSTYFNPDFRATVQKENLEAEAPRDYTEATAQVHGIEKDAVQASRDYYYRNKWEIDAYFTYERALKKKDPLVDGNQPPSQLPLPQVEHS